MKFFNKSTIVALAAVSISVASFDTHAQRRERDRHGHRHGHRHDRHHHRNDDGAWLSLGVLLGSLAALSTTAATSDRYKEIIGGTDRILEQVMNRELPASFYDGFRSEESFAKHEDYEIDLILVQTLQNL